MFFFWCVNVFVVALLMFFFCSVNVFFVLLMLSFLSFERFSFVLLMFSFVLLMFSFCAFNAFLMSRGGGSLKPLPPKIADALLVKPMW